MTCPFCDDTDERCDVTFETDLGFYNDAQLFDYIFVLLPVWSTHQAPPLVVQDVQVGHDYDWIEWMMCECLLLSEE